MYFVACEVERLSEFVLETQVVNLTPMSKGLELDSSLRQWIASISPQGESV